MKSVLLSTTARPAAIALVQALIVLMPAGAARGVDVDEVRWGFDGRSVQNQFNLLSVLVSNPEPEPFDGALRLTKSLSSRVGARIEERLFLAPLTSRWIQFFPYLDSASYEWTLSWGRGPSQRIEFRQAPFGETARVFLDFDDTLGGAGLLKRFPAALFPAVSTGTDGLQAVFLDHAPKWDKPRREAFLAWLRRGGVVHLFVEAGGRHPVLEAELAHLNAPLDRQRIGAGLVFRHARDRQQLDRTFLKRLRQQERAGHQFRTDDAADQADGEASEEDRETISEEAQEQIDTDELERATPVYGGGYNPDAWDPTSAMFGQLSRVIEPNHNWSLIYGLTASYTLLIFPGGYLFARRLRDFRLSLLALGVTIALFSVALAAIGRRGYGESTTVHTAAIAKHLHDGSYDVTQWSNLFVTGGDDYLVEHKGRDRLYSTAQAFEAVNGVIDNGVEGRFLVDIPPYSSRRVLHRSLAQAPPVELEVQQWQVEERLQTFSAKVGEAFGSMLAESRLPPRIALLHGRRIYSIQREGTHLSLKKGSVPLANQLNVDQLRAMERTVFGGDFEELSPDQRFRNLFPAVVGASLDLRSRSVIKNFRLPEGRAKLLIYTGMPSEFSLANDSLGQQAGVVLFSIDVFAPDPT